MSGPKDTTAAETAEPKVAKGFQPAQKADVEALRAEIGLLRNEAAERKAKVAALVDKHINQWARGRVEATVIRALLLEIAETL
jgi:hypothetical protein